MLAVATLVLWGYPDLQADELRDLCMAETYHGEDILSHAHDNWVERHKDHRLCHPVIRIWRPPAE